MPVKRYAVKLSEVERARLEKFTSSTSKTNTLQSKTRAKIILHLGENGGKPLTPEQTAKKCKTHQENVYKIRKQFLTEGIDRILNRKKRLTPPVTPKVTGEVEAHIAFPSCIVVYSAMPKPIYNKFSIHQSKSKYNTFI